MYNWKKINVCKILKIVWFFGIMKLFLNVIGIKLINCWCFLKYFMISFIIKNYKWMN